MNLSLDSHQQQIFSLQTLHSISNRFTLVLSSNISSCLYWTLPSEFAKQFACYLASANATCHTHLILYWITPQTFGEISCEVPHLIFYLYVYSVAQSGIIYLDPTDSRGFQWLVLQFLKRVSRQHKTQNVSATV
jgi:hypothetical protein